jgi:hypothetical protein
VSGPAMHLVMVVGNMHGQDGSRSISHDESSGALTTGMSETPLLST